MSDQAELHVVLGTGQVGKAVLRVLGARGARVRAVNRSGRAVVPAGGEVVAADLEDVGAAIQACRGAAVVYLCANPPLHDWPERWPQLMHGAVEGAVAAGARFVFADDLYMYGPAKGPLREDHAYTAKGPKGLTRAIVANLLMEVHRSGKLRAVIARASDLYGPEVVASMAGEQVFGQALAGSPARLLGALDAPHTYTYVDDFARALVTLGASDAAFGEVWHVPAAPPVTQRQFVEQVFAALGRPPQLRSAPRWLVRMLGRFNRQLRELEEVLYTVEQPFVVDHAKYDRAFGEPFTPLETGIRQTLDWYRARTDGAAGERARNRKVVA